MASFKMIPYGKNVPTDLTTSGDVETQIWQQLLMQRHLQRNNSIYNSKTSAPFIDLAKEFYFSAKNSNWKPSALLLYYCYMNLAKTLIISKKSITGKIIKKTNLLHGITLDRKLDKSLIEWEITIDPPRENDKPKKMFGLLYESLTNESWPYHSRTKIPVKQILSYCTDMAQEIQEIYSINPAPFNTQSIFRYNETHAWIELVVYPIMYRELYNQLNICGLSNLRESSIHNVETKAEWFKSAHINELALNSCFIIRAEKKEVLNDTIPSIYDRINEICCEKLKKVFVANPISDNPDMLWQVCPQMKHGNLMLKWHPLLSNYLFAYVLSDIVRYHPEYLYRFPEIEFISNAWNSQAAITTLRYFLFNISKNRIRINN